LAGTGTATWTGDNQSNWDHLAWSIPMALNLGLSGQPFVGPDIGGFSGNADGKLFARWMGIGAMLPFARAHSINVSTNHEPWAFGPECEATCRRALERRYRLMPYLYTLFHDATKTGVPVVRPAFFANPADAALRDADDCFLLGVDVLVRCGVDQESVECASPLPAGDWRSFEPCPLPGGGRDPELPDLRFRAGSIVPLGPVMQHVDAAPLDPLTLVVCPDADGEARGRLYEDQGDGHEHENGIFRISTYTARREAHHLVIRLADEQGRMHRHPRRVEVVVVAKGGVIHTGHGNDGHRIHVKL